MHVSCGCPFRCGKFEVWILVLVLCVCVCVCVCVYIYTHIYISLSIQQGWLPLSARVGGALCTSLTVCNQVQEREVGGFKAEAEEEFEDAEGNVYNRRTYEDLKRQGII